MFLLFGKWHSAFLWNFESLLFAEAVVLIRLDCNSTGDTWPDWTDLSWAGHLVPFGFCCPLFIMAYTTFLPSCSFMVLWLRHINKIFVLFFALLPFCPSVNLFSWKFMTFCKKNYSFGNHDLRFLINIHIYVALAYFCFNWNFLRIF